MNMRATFVCTALSIAWGGVVLGDGAPVVSPLLGAFEVGVLCAQDTGVVQDAPGTVSGTTHVIDDLPAFVADTRIVPAVVGVGFGVLTHTALEDRLDNVLITVQHPPFAKSGATEQSFYTSIGPQDDPSITFYQFDYGYELALGDWTTTATINGVFLYEVTFKVVPPDAAPELADVCGYIDLLG